MNLCQKPLVCFCGLCQLKIFLKKKSKTNTDGNTSFAVQKKKLTEWYIKGQQFALRGTNYYYFFNISPITQKSPLRCFKMKHQKITEDIWIQLE